MLNFINATLHSTKFEVQHNCLLKKLLFSSLPHLRMWSCCIPESTEAQKALKRYTFPSIKPGFKFIFYRKRSQCSNFKDGKVDKHVSK